MKHVSNETLITAEGLSKKYCKDLKKGLWYGVKDLFTGFSSNSRKRELRSKEFWACKDITFELKRGECLGLIGHNGAGKSTLLKVLNGLINPDDGKVTMRGRVGALIELGAGFNPILSGRENIYNNGAILGFSRKQIDDKLEEIIEFSELEEFIDMPVQNYSSGMKVRLGFAVAAQMEPDILLIDEVLAVGDLGFVLKCFKKIDSILPNTAIVFVSHSMPMVSRICNQVILLDRGKPKYQGTDVGKAIDLYYRKFVDNDSNVIFDDKSVTLQSINVVNPTNNEKEPILRWLDTLKIELKLKLISSKLAPTIFLTIYDKEQRPVALLEPNTSNDSLSVNEDGIMEFSVVHEKLQFSKGIYSINIIVNGSENNEPKLRINSAATFQVSHHEDVWPPFYLKASYEEIST